MKKIVLSCLLFSSLLFSQNKDKKELIEFDPRFRFGPSYQINFGNNSFSKDYNNELGYGLSLYVMRIQKFRLGVGYDYAKLKPVSSEAIGHFNHVNSISYSFQIERNFNFSKKIEISPFVGYAAVVSNFKASGLLAKQHGNELRLGTTVDYGLTKTYSLFFGLNYGYYFSNLDASPDNQKYFGRSNKIQFSLGFEIN